MAAVSSPSSVEASLSSSPRPLPPTPAPSSPVSSGAVNSTRTPAGLSLRTTCSLVLCLVGVAVGVAPVSLPTSSPSLGSSSPASPEPNQ